MSRYRIELDGKVYEMEIDLMTGGEVSHTPIKQDHIKSEKPEKEVSDYKASHPDQSTAAGNAGVITAPMPGTVIRIEKAEGDTVKAGELVLVLEAMKMENEITAPFDGRIAELNPAVGRTVAGGEKLFEIR